MAPTQTDSNGVANRSATTTESEDSGESAEYTQPEKLGASTKEVSYERKQTISNPERLEKIPEPPFGVWIIEYYDRFQNYQPFSWAEPHKDPEAAAEELRKHSNNRQSTSFRAVWVDEEVVRDE
jgi:hypothetical protein